MTYPQIDRRWALVGAMIVALAACSTPGGASDGTAGASEAGASTAPSAARPSAATDGEPGQFGTASVATVTIDGETFAFVDLHCVTFGDAVHASAGGDPSFYAALPPRDPTTNEPTGDEPPSVAVQFAPDGLDEWVWVAGRDQAGFAPPELLAVSGVDDYTIERAQGNGEFVYDYRATGSATFADKVPFVQHQTFDGSTPPPEAFVTATGTFEITCIGGG